MSRWNRVGPWLGLLWLVVAGCGDGGDVERPGSTVASAAASSVTATTAADESTTTSGPADRVSTTTSDAAQTVTTASVTGDVDLTAVLPGSSVLAEVVGAPVEDVPVVVELG